MYQSGGARRTGRRAIGSTSNTASLPQPLRYCQQPLASRIAGVCGASKCPLENQRRSFTLAKEAQSSCLDRRPQRSLACQATRTRSSSTLKMLTLSSAMVWCFVAAAAVAITVTCGAASQESLRAYPTPRQTQQNLQQLSLEQSFHRPTRSVAATAKVASPLAANLQQVSQQPQPQEQSRLAKLCKQTSNVLASVLPAPFGGLKRSILCQFFGQVPLNDSPEDETAPHTSIALMQHLSPQTGYPQIALPLPSSAKHPIELVIDQHRREYLLAQQKQDPLNGFAADFTHDLGASGSILDYAYEKRVEVPKSIASVLKSSGFSAPFDHIFRPATRSQLSSSPLVSASGWRIFNQFEATTSTSTPKPSSLKAYDAVSASTKPPSTTTPPPQVSSTSVTERRMKMNDEFRSTVRDSSKDEKISLLVIGKPPQAVVQQQRQVAVTKTEPLITTTKRMESTIKPTIASFNVTPSEPPVRIIEVNAQIMNTSTILLAPLLANEHNNGNKNESISASKVGGKPDLNQIQLREELVIASINNLTRIAFGNHLRDTVKVINKLIDQQSDLFSNNGLHKDSMQPAESKQQPKSVPKPSSTPPPSTSTMKPANRKPATKDPRRPVKSRFLKQAASNQRLSSTTKSTTTKSLGKETAGSAFSFPEATVDDWRRISRGKSGSSASSRASQAAIIGEMQQDKSPWLVSPSRQLTTTTTTRGSFQSWLAPDKSFTVSTAEDASMDLARKWDSKKQQPNKQPVGLVLNRLSKDKLAKRDSLTTLKSYLTTRAPPGTTLPAASHPTSVTGAQSRWMPTVVLAGSSLQPKFTKLPASTVRIPSTTTARPSSSSSMTASTTNATSIKTETTVSMESMPSTSSVEANYEARASESINRYTTHLVNDANELLATTRRFSLQPLPQTAQTGEFFNAETIASWPERYQTRIGQAMEASSTVAMADTTRRSGETYQSSTLARHRMDAEVGSKATTLSMAPSPTTLDLMTSRMITTLPENHKLTTFPQEKDHQSTTSTLPTTIRRSTTGYSTPSPHSVAYTLIGPYTQSDSELETGSADEFPLIAADHPNALSIYIEQPLNGSSASLRPPYADHHSVLEQPQTIDDMDPLVLLDREQHLNNRTYAQQRFIEMLNPTFVSGEMQRYPVGATINQQRFNLSALKFLAQNLMSNRRNKPSEEPLYRHNQSNNSWQDHLLASELDNSQANSSSQPQMRSLLDLFSDAVLSPQVQVYDSSNDSTVVNSSTANNGSAKSIFGRAGNLLSDLKQLEQKRAAALLAAIRYQVPSPLVRPWEMAQGFYHFANPNPQASARISSRLDPDFTGMDQDYLVDDLLLSKLIRMALRKQRVVPRSVLEARLSKQADRRGYDSVERRLDSIEDTDQFAGAEKPIEFKSDDSGRSDMSRISMHTGTRGPMNKLLNQRASNGATQDYVFENSNHSRGDVEGEDIRLLHQRDATGKLSRSERPMSESSRANLSPEESTGEDKKKLKSKDEVKANFECANRPAGFYPDSATTCRTFYHCSNTGHLLTFNCPQQSRFDEKSLKCGPWYEVPCDLRRTR